MGVWIASLGAIVSAVADVRTGRVPNSLTYSLGAVGIVLAAFAPAPVRNASLLAIAGIGLPALFLCARGLLGGGDAKLLVALAALEGFPLILYTVFYAFLFGGVIAAIVLARAGRLRAVFLDAVRFRDVQPAAEGPALPFAAFVCAGNLAALVALRI